MCGRAVREEKVCESRATSQEVQGDNRPSDLTITLFLSMGMGECVREAECDMRGEFLCATAADIFFFSMTKSGMDGT